MTLPIIPDGFFAALDRNLADRLEAVVGDEPTFLGKIDANMTRIFVKFEQFEFVESFKYRRRLSAGFLRVGPSMVTATVTSRSIVRRPAPRQPKFHHDRQRDVRIVRKIAPPCVKRFCIGGTLAFA
jgi:hypothetical protein